MAEIASYGPTAITPFFTGSLQRGTWPPGIKMISFLASLAARCGHVSKFQQMGCKYKGGIKLLGGVLELA